MPPEEDRNVPRQRKHAQKFGTDRSHSSGDILTDRQTHRQRQTDHS